MVNCTENHEKKKMLKNVYQNYYCSNYYNISINKYKVKCGTSLRFWENIVWINYIDCYGWF